MSDLTDFLFANIDEEENNARGELARPSIRLDEDGLGVWCDAMERIVDDCQARRSIVLMLLEVESREHSGSELTALEAACGALAYTYRDWPGYQSLWTL